MGGQFDGKGALVTGAGSGIGRATALAFARHGARVVVSDIDTTAGEETVRQVTSAGGDARFVVADVGEEADVRALIDAAVAAYGRLDYAHNNAGIQAVGSSALHEVSLDVWDRVLRVNLTGVWLCLKYEIAHMLGHGGGAIVNTASIFGLVSGRDATYTAGKHGVVGLTKTAALTYAQRGIRVNAVCPGFTETPMLQDVLERRPEVGQRMMAGTPMGRIGTVEEIAAAVLWLCSDAASFVTGAALPVDGGWVAQ